MARSKKSQESEASTIEAPLITEDPTISVETVEEVKQEEVPVPELKETPEEQITETVAEEIKVEDKHPEKTCEKSEKVVKTDTSTSKTATGFLHGGSIYRGMI